MENPVKTEDTPKSTKEPSKCNVPVMDTLVIAEKYQENSDVHNPVNGKESFGHKENAEVSNDSDSEVEITVDAVHARLAPMSYICEACRKEMDSKRDLKAHFKAGCSIACLRCGHAVYQKTSASGIGLIKKCSKKCIPDLGRERPEL